MSEDYGYHYMTMWIELYSPNELANDKCTTKSVSNKQSNLKSESIIDTYISSEPEFIYDEWKMIWN